MGRPKTTIRDLYAKTVVGVTGCWEWSGPKTSVGYAKASYEDKTVNAHRLLWFLLHGEIPKGLCVMHLCDVRHCINPAHLKLGTPSENTKDMYAKKRCRGRTHPEHIQKQIYELSDRGESQTYIALILGIERHSVARTIKGRR